MITLYDAARCPYCARVRIALAEKDVEVETVDIQLDDRPAWIYEKNSTGRVPVIEEDAWTLPESAVIMEYLEERYPDPPLLPADPAARALARVWIFRHDDFTSPYYALRRGEEGAAERFEGQLAKLDAAL
ncbi:MAG: glutathione S-transferase N-terminal domain-containing protein, partial [Actinobacteria bacterium]|nr:glutathione S-transferase N-terminal domain-containing protein [Actinomycetota bacterium]